MHLSKAVSGSDDEEKRGEGMTTFLKGKNMINSVDSKLLTRKYNRTEHVQKMVTILLLD